MTGSDAGDGDQVDPLLDQIEGPIGRFTADGAYDDQQVYDAVKRRSSGQATKVVIPPRKMAVPSTKIGDEQTKRDRHIMMIQKHGRMVWQKAHGCGRRSLVETAIGRYKAIIGDRLHARHNEAQTAEVAIAVKALNQLTSVAKPVSVKVD